MRQEIDEIQIKNLAIDEEIERTEKHNEEMQKRLDALNAQIEELKEKKKEQEELIDRLDPSSPGSKSKQIVFARKGTAAYKNKGGKMAQEVSNLPELASDDSDDDDA